MAVRVASRQLSEVFGQIWKLSVDFRKLFGKFREISVNKLIFQAFICAVQLDPTHVEAWIDLGVLYESKRQFKDAFKCFHRAYSCSVHRAEPREELFHKAKSLQGSFIFIFNFHNVDQDMESSAAGPSQAGLTSIEKAWTMPIPAELTQRQAARCAPPRNFSEILPEIAQVAKTEADVKKEPTEKSETEDSEKVQSTKSTSSQSSEKKTSASTSSGPSWLMNEMESNVLRTLQNNSNALTPFQKAELERLQYLKKCTEYFKKHVKSENVPADAAFFEEKAQKETDYAKELSVIKGRRVPGLSAPTEFSHSITANELIK